EWKRWRGYRLMAVDGSFIRLPSAPALLEYFGGLGKEGAAASAPASMLFDLENGIVVDAKIVPVSGNERALAKEHVRVLEGLESYERGKELIVFDRGYPSHELIKFLQDKETAYVMRIRKGFVSGKKLPGGRDGYAELGKSGWRVRVIQITLPGGEEETLITNMGEERLEYEAFEELYNKRRGIETEYKTVKQKLELENFSGRTVETIKQDFPAVMTLANMLANLVREAGRKVKKDREKRGNKYEYRVKVNHAVGVLKDRLIGVLLEERPGKRVRFMKELVREIGRRVVPVRLNREVERNKTPRKARFHHNHKSNC
ncbi:MAG: transposase, partial [Spirochaetaceae bacterium]|nr:transposase [Spirochaetaceae bacterium]